MSRMTNVKYATETTGNYLLTTATHQGLCAAFYALNATRRQG